ncbi:MAG: DUF2073 domain-containing protein [bacterium]|nr:DUF2073 domain-containing protein [bacterium]
MLTLQYIPFNEIENLSSERRIAKLLAIVKKNKIILMQGRLKSIEEAGLIEKTMEEVNKEFKGIELCTIYPTIDNNSKVTKQIKNAMIKMLMGDREGLTIIGPATVVKEIKRNPDKIELFTHSLASRRLLQGRK